MFGALLSAGTSLLGGLFSSSANKKAAKYAAQAAQEAARINTESINKFISLVEQGYPEQRAAVESGYDDAMKMWRQSYERGMAQLGITTEEMDALFQEIESNQLGAIDKSTKEAMATLKGMRIDNAPGMSFLRQVVANPERLTDEQNYQLDQMRDRMNDNIRSSSGLAGNGRGAAAVFKQVEADATNDFMAQNRAAAMTAATNMASADNLAAREAAALAERSGGARANIYGQVGRDRANLAQWQGEQAINMEDLLASRSGNTGIAKAESLVSMDQKKNDTLGNAYMAIGKANADAAQQAGAAKAGAATANGAIWGQTIGNIGATIADYNKQRQSRYGGY